MYYKFLKYIESKNLFSFSDTILLAVSGGRDSMSMMHLFRTAGYNFAVAHFNHKTRNGESDRDENFVIEQCKKNGICYYSTNVDIKSLLKKGEGNNFQDLARKYRYEWLEKIRHDHKFSYIATAHNQDDNIETFLYKLIKGSGIKGLQGIKPKSDFIVRPLLDLSRQYIDRYIAENEIPFVDDSSNTLTGYDRNFIRHKIIPLFRQLHPNFDKRIMVSIRNLISNNELFNFLLGEYSKPYISKKKDHVEIDKKILSAYDNRGDLLYNTISNYGFNHDQCRDIVNSIGNTGTTYESQAYKLVNDREKFFIQYKTELLPFYIEIHEPGTYKTEYGNVIIKESDNLQELDFNSNIKYLNGDKLVFPVILRTRKPGDIFSPFGLKGKTQKLKKYLNDKKVSGPDKKKVLILESGGLIHLIAGIEISYNMRVTDKCKKMISIEIK